MSELQTTPQGERRNRALCSVWFQSYKVKHRRKPSFTGFEGRIAVLGLCGCLTTLPQVGLLQTMDVSSLRDLEARSPFAIKVSSELWAPQDSRGVHSCLSCFLVTACSLWRLFLGRLLPQTLLPSTQDHIYMSLWVFVEWGRTSESLGAVFLSRFTRLSDIGLESTCIQYDLVFIWLNWKDHILVPNKVAFTHRYQGLGHEHVILRTLLCPLQMAALWVKDCRKYEGPSGGEWSSVSGSRCQLCSNFNLWNSSFNSLMACGVR